VVALVALALPAVGQAAGTGSISGTVTEVGGGPLEGVKVCAESFGPPEEEFECAETEFDGTYTVPGLGPGSYVVEFVSQHGNFVSQYYDGRGTWEEADRIELRTGEAKAGVNAALERGASISGTVKAAATGLPVSGVAVCAFSTNGPGFGCASTNGAGGYAITGLPAGLYEVTFEPLETEQDVVFQSYQGGLVSVAPQAVVTGIDAALQPGGQIAGTVRAAATGAPLAGVEVCITTAEEAWALGCLKTPASGGYRFTGVWKDSFKVVFSPEAGELENGKLEKLPVDPWPTVWWSGQASFATATPIAMTPPAVITGIDGSLGPGPIVAPPLPPALAPVVKKVVKPKPLKCKRGFVKKKLKGKARCVKRHKAKRHHGKHHPEPRKHAGQAR
jgi:hypothetical protein